MATSGLQVGGAAGRAALARLHIHHILAASQSLKQCCTSKRMVASLWAAWQDGWHPKLIRRMLPSLFLINWPPAAAACCSCLLCLPAVPACCACLLCLLRLRCTTSTAVSFLLLSHYASHTLVLHNYTSHQVINVPGANSTLRIAPPPQMWGSTKP